MYNEDEEEDDEYEDYDEDEYNADKWGIYEREDSEEETEEENAEKEEDIEDLGIAKTLKGNVGTIDPSFIAEPDESANLEEMAEQPARGMGEESSFSEFMSSSQEMPTPTLQSGNDSENVSFKPQQQENLEQIGASSSIGTSIPSSNTTRTRREEDYVAVYNQPDYTDSRGGEESVFNRMRERGMVTRNIEEMRQVQPRTVIDDWHEAGMSDSRLGGENLVDYAIAEPERLEERDSRLPFERKIKYRELRRGRRVESKGY